MDVAYSLASGALGAIIVAIAWVVQHSKQITSVLALLPTVAKDIEAARTAIEKHLEHQAAAPAPTTAAVTSTVPPTA